MVRSWVREVNVKLGMWTGDKMRGGGKTGSLSRVGTIREEEVLGLCMHTTLLEHMGPVLICMPCP